MLATAWMSLGWGRRMAWCTERRNDYLASMIQIAWLFHDANGLGVFDLVGAGDVLDPIRRGA